MMDWFATALGSFLSVFGVHDDCRAKVLENKVILRPQASTFALWDELEASISLANDILGPTRTVDIVAGWRKNDLPASNTHKQIAVYLVESPGGVAAGAAFRDSVRQSLQAFKENQLTVAVNQKYDQCTDVDECVTDLYPAETSRLAGEVIGRVASLDAAKTDLTCPVIVFQQRDLEAYDSFINITAEDGQHIAQKYLLSPILLHEVGHQVEFIPSSSASWRPTFDHILSTVNEQQREELRADAFTAKTISDGCRLDLRPFDYDRKETCMAVIVQWYLHYRYLLFDRSRAGLCRLYLPDSQRHPNLLIRVLLQGLVVSEEIAPGKENMFRKELDRHERVLKALLQKSWIRTQPGCERVSLLAH